MESALVERERELDAAARILERARTGDGGVLLLEGPAGIGKTAVLDAVAARRRGLRVLRGAGGELERELAFGLVRDLLEPVLRAAPAARRRRWLSGAAASAAAVFGRRSARAVDDASVAYGLYWLVSALAEDEPLLLVADDLQWSDRPSLRWIAYLARRIEGLPVALVAACRPPAADLLAGVPALSLQPLSAEATAGLVAARCPAPAAEFARACHDATGGNPLLVSELLETVHAEGVEPDAAGAARIHAVGGPRLSRAVLGRLGRMTPEAGRLARAVAVLGDGCPLRQAAELARLAPAEAEAALPALVAAGVLADRRRLAFRHPLLRTAVRLELPAPARAAEHARAAALLRAAGAAPETIAAQLLAAGPVGEPWAPSVLAAAAQSALMRGSPEPAAVYLRAALAEGRDRDRAALTRALGNALVRLGDPDAAAVLDAALALARDARTRRDIVEESWDPLVGSGRVAEARTLVLDALDGPVDRQTVTRLSGRLAMLRAIHGPGPGDELVRALRHRSSDLDLARAGDRYAAGALATLAAICDGTAADAAALARMAMDDRFREADARAGRPHYIAMAALAMAGEVEAALGAATRALERSRARGSVMGLGAGLAWRSLLHVLSGDVGEAETDARAALHVLSETRLREPQVGVTASLAWALMERGELDEAQALLDAAPAAAAWGGAALAALRARLHLARHDPGTALARLAAGEAEVARALARVELAEADRFGAEFEIGRALRLVALVDGARADDPNLAAAIARLRASRAELELARALVDAGAALRRAGERARSRAPLREGMELAHGRGATALLERARTELRAAGARPRSIARAGVDALTPSERRVASLAADGLANAQIAQELFVTVRTVEMHLTASYRKLDVVSRADLAGALSKPYGRPTSRAAPRPARVATHD